MNKLDEAVCDKAHSIVSDMGQMFPDYAKGRKEMYSYDSPAHYFWAGCVAELLVHGATEAECEFWLQSKLTRWLMDSHAHEVYNFARGFFRRVAKDELSAARGWMKGNA